MTLPVCVAVAHHTSRWKFFREVCLPSILSNYPAEIAVELNNGGMSVGYWKNKAAKMGRQRYLMFVDDDTKLMPGAIEKLCDAMKGAPENVKYAYSDFDLVIHPGVQFNVSSSRKVKSMPWNAALLRKGNYISGVSLVDTEVFDKFGGYEESLKRLVDWEFWLRLATVGIEGVYVPETLFEAHQIDRSVTMQVSDDEAVAAIRKRYPE